SQVKTLALTSAIRGELRRLLAADDERISPCLDRILRQLSQEWQRIEDEVDQVTHDIEAHAAADPACRRRIAVPGVGRISAIALVAAIGNGGAFSKGRDFGAWLGLVPRQHSTGGKPRLMGVSKQGNTLPAAPHGLRCALVTEQAKRTGEHAANVRDWAVL